MVRKQQRPEKRVPGSVQEYNCGPKKRGRKRKVLERSVSNRTETEESKENGVSETGDENGEKVEGGEMGSHKESLDLECKKVKGNGESERRVRFDINCEVMGEDTNGVSVEKISDEIGEKVEGGKMGNHGESLELECEKEKENREMGNQGERLELECEKGKENGESDRGVKLDDNYEAMGEDTNGISVEKNGFDEEMSSLRKRLRGGGKRVNYSEDAFDEEIEAILGKRIRKRRGGQKGKKFTAAGVQEKEFTTTKKRGRKSKKDGKAKESERLTSEGVEAGDLEEEDEVEGNKESAGDLRISRNQTEQQHVLKESEKKVNKVRNFSSMWW